MHVYNAHNHQCSGKMVWIPGRKGFFYELKMCVFCFCWKKYSNGPRAGLTLEPRRSTIRNNMYMRCYLRQKCCLYVIYSEFLLIFQIFNLFSSSMNIFSMHFCFQFFSLFLFSTLGKLNVVQKQCIARSLHMMMHFCFQVSFKMESISNLYQIMGKVTICQSKVEQTAHYALEWLNV